MPFEFAVVQAIDYITLMLDTCTAKDSFLRTLLGGFPMLSEAGSISEQSSRATIILFAADHCRVRLPKSFCDCIVLIILRVK